MTPAEEIASLKEEVAYLKGELGLSVQNTEIAAMQTLGLTLSEACIAIALYRARGRVLTPQQLYDATGAERSNDIIRVIRCFVSHIKGKIGADVVESTRGLGYRMTPAGVALLSPFLTGGRQ